MKVKSILSSFGLSLLCVLWVGQDRVVAELQRGTELPDVFEAVPLAREAVAGHTAATAPHVVRYRPALVKLNVLAAIEPKTELNLNLFPSTSFVGVVDRVERRSKGQFSVTGHLENVPYGSFIIVVEQDAAAATIRAPSLSSTLFDLRYVDGGLHLIREIDVANLPLCGGGVPSPPVLPLGTPSEQTEPNETTQRLLGPASPTALCTPPEPVFDVMIVYTGSARQAAGGTNAINALCQLAIDETNQAYANSQVDARVRLVYRGEVAYNESGSYAQHLYWVTNPRDGVMDGVHTLRDTYRADFVSLWVADTAYCGMAWCPASDPSDAFTVVTWFCATGYYTYAHEMGHNQGCAHDRDNAGTGPPCPIYSYSYGYRFTGNSFVLWRTIMAYAPGTRIQHFSNPDVTFDGQPTGVPIGQANEAHNAQTINVRRSAYEGFRQTRFDIWVDYSYSGSEQGTFGSPYNTVAEGVQAIITGVGASELPSLWIKAGSSNETIMINKPMTIRACGGTVTIGAP